MSKGYFLVIEGIDGAGTTTQTKLLSKWLRKEGKEVLTTHEPFNKNGHIGKIIKEHLIQESEQHSPESIALAFAADRLVHLEDVILPALKKGKIVISDRYYHSSLVYQPTHGASFSWVKEINKYARKPDLTFILDVPAREGMRRLKERDGKSKIIFENEQFQEEIRKRYKSLNEKLPDENLKIVNSNREIQEVHEEIKEIFRREIS